MKFKLDENLDPRLATPLTLAGHDVSSVREQNLGGHADAAIFAVCAAENRTLVKLDLDFSNPVRFPTSGTAGIVVLRPAKATLPLIERLLAELPALLRAHSPAGKLWVVQLGRLRVFAPDEKLPD